MLNKKTIYDFLGQGFCLFGVTVTMLNVLCVLVGESAKEISRMFVLGSSGLSVETMLQLLIVSLLITVTRFFYFNDIIVKKISIAARTALMLLTILVMIAIVIYLCGWFPIRMWQPWLMFLAGFAICSLIGIGITYLKEELDNKNMQEALKKLKEGE